jgi:hypothetical protein
LLGDADGDHHHHSIKVVADAELAVAESHSVEPSALAWKEATAVVEECAHAVHGALFQPSEI